MNNNYTYSMILDYSEDGLINFFFPEFDGLMSCSSSDENPIEAAQECLALAILDLEEKNETLPERIPEKDIVVEKDQRLVFLNIWMPYHRSKFKETYVKKTLTIPTWLDILAKQNSINFSETLVNALKEKLNLK